MTDTYTNEYVAEARRHAALSERAEIIAGLHQLADWLGNNPNVPLSKWAAGIDEYNLTDDDVVAVAIAEGTIDKVYYNSFVELCRTFRGGVTYKANAGREQVCTKVVTGSHVVHYEAVEAHDEVVEDVEWECRPLLSGDA